MNKEICFISRPGNGLSYCCFQSEPNPKPMPGMERNGKIIVAGVGKQRFDVLRKTWKRCRVEKKKQEDALGTTQKWRTWPSVLISAPDPSSNASTECVTRCARS